MQETRIASSHLLRLLLLFLTCPFTVQIIASLCSSSVDWNICKAHIIHHSSQLRNTSAQHFNTEDLAVLRIFFFWRNNPRNWSIFNYTLLRQRTRIPTALLSTGIYCVKLLQWRRKLSSEGRVVVGSRQEMIKDDGNSIVPRRLLIISATPTVAVEWNHLLSLASASRA